MLKSWKKFYHLRLFPFLFDVIDQIEENNLLLAGRKKKQKEEEEEENVHNEMKHTIMQSINQS